MTSSSTLWIDICNLLDTYKNSFDSKVTKTDNTYRIHLPKMEDHLYFHIDNNNIKAEIGEFKENISIDNNTTYDMVTPYIINFLQKYRMLFLTKEFETTRQTQHIQRPNYLDVIHNPYMYNQIISEQHSQQNNITYL